MRRRFGLAWVLPLLACASAPRDAAPPRTRAPVAVARAAVPPAVEPRLTLRIEADAEARVVMQRRRGEQTLPPLPLRGPAAVAEVFALQGWTERPHLVVPLSSLLADAATPLEVELEPSEACKAPWLVDLAAPTPTLQSRLRLRSWLRPPTCAWAAGACSRSPTTPSTASSA
ncbi:MAG: hypothetical protein U0168_00385 [Nannocystaceae bacterium]